MRVAHVFSDAVALACKISVKNAREWRQERLALRSYMLTCLNQYSAAVAEC